MVSCQSYRSNDDDNDDSNDNNSRPSSRSNGSNKQNRQKCRRIRLKIDTNWRYCGSKKKVSSIFVCRGRCGYGKCKVSKTQRVCVFKGTRPNAVYGKMNVPLRCKCDRN
jgi:hypothetical protein